MAKKTKKTKEVDEGGRPWFNGKDESMVVAKLKEAFTIGSNVKRACANAEISIDSYYRYLKEYPELRNVFENLREKPVLKAEAIVAEKLNDKDIDTAKWLLERRAKGEYSTRQEIAPINPDEDDLSEEEKEQLRKIVRASQKKNDK
ncbi:MAG: hypothetical protein UY18_C0017G0009 [Microgenomates group bacterium GW2011_GWF2_47_9]|nr:MAG: hypothetical protein UY18_C0017G0009 [Microgenomates group bacterium GW2011_GWF2_47_9]